MRSFSDVNLLVILVFVLVVCALANLHTTYVMTEWLWEVGLRFLGQAAGFIRHSL